MSPAGNLKEQLERYRQKVKKCFDDGLCRDDEAATKAALILPLFTILGYDVTDPRQCKPEYKADWGESKSKQPVDWAFFVNEKLAFLVEAKAAGKEIDHYDEQLGDYYGKEAAVVKLGILTTGVRWRFFTDLANENVMDKKPFLEWDVLNGAIPDDLLTVLQPQNFKPELIKEVAKGKHRQSLLVEELTRLLAPSDEFLAFAIKNKERPLEVRNLTAKVVAEWKPIFAGAIQEWAEQQRLDRVLGRPPIPAPEQQPRTEAEPQVLTCQGRGVTATGRDTPQGFVVRSGSFARLDEVPSLQKHFPNVCEVRGDLRKRGVLVPEGDKLIFAQDYTLHSPSLAASVVLGRSSNGRADWKAPDGRTLKQIQEAQAGGTPCAP